MQEKDFVSYEYRTKTVKAKDQTKAIDMYEAFGWEVTATTPTFTDGVTLSLKRDRKQKHLYLTLLEHPNKFLLVLVWLGLAIPVIFAFRGG